MTLVDRPYRGGPRPVAARRRRRPTRGGSQRPPTVDRCSGKLADDAAEKAFHYYACRKAARGSRRAGHSQWRTIKRAELYAFLHVLRHVRTQAMGAVEDGL